MLSLFEDFKEAPKPERVKVVFRVDKETGDVTAVFPEILADLNGLMTGYAHVGQHHAVGWSYLNDCTRPAQEHETVELMRELKQVYDDCELVVYKRINRSMRNNLADSLRVERSRWL